MEGKEVQYIGFWMRFISRIIDTSIIFGISLIATFIAFGSRIMELANKAPADGRLAESDLTIPGLDLFNIFLSVVFMIVVIIMWRYLKATPGKMIISAQVVDAETLENPSYLKCFIRYFAYIISFITFCLGFFWIGWDRRKQGFHDKLAGTVVIRK